MCNLETCRTKGFSGRSSDAHARAIVSVAALLLMPLPPFCRLALALAGLPPLYAAADHGVCAPGVDRISAEANRFGDKWHLDVKRWQSPGSDGM